MQHNTNPTDSISDDAISTGDLERLKDCIGCSDQDRRYLEELHQLLLQDTDGWPNDALLPGRDKHEWEERDQIVSACKDYFHLLTCGCLVLDESLRIRNYNTALAELLGPRGNADLHDSPLFGLFPSVELEARAREVLAARGRSHDIRIVSIDLADDSPSQHLTFDIYHTASREGDRLLVIVQAVHGLTQSHPQDALQNLQNRHDAALGQMAVGIAYATPDGRWLQVNSKFSELTGQARAGVAELSAYDIVSAAETDAWIAALDDVISGRKRCRCHETRYTHVDGATAWVRLNVEYVPGHGETAGYLLLIAEDISRYRHTLARVQYLESHDRSTGLANDGLLLKRLEDALTQRESGQTVAVVLVHPDRLKSAKEALGYEQGETLMVALVQRLVETAGNAVRCARLDSDTLVALLVTQDNHTQITARVDALSGSLSQPLEVANCTVSTTCSIGIAAANTAQITARDLLRNAVQALRLACQRGGGQIQWHGDALGLDPREGLRLENELGLALKHNQLTLRYQLRANVRNGAFVGVEALPYWRHPRKGLLTPNEFLPAVSDTPAGDALAAWALLGACRQARIWNDTHRDLAVAVGIPGRQIRQRGIVDRIRNILQVTGLEPRLLELEIHGGGPVWNDGDTLDNLRQLRGLGVRLAVGDFGTGHISLEHLKRTGVNVIKINRRYLAGAITEPCTAAIVKTILAVGDHMQLDVIAEGVEHPAQIDFLRANHCEIMQGDAFSPPVPAADIDAMLREGPRPPTPAADTADQRVLMILDDEENILSALTRLLRRDGYHVIASDSPEKAFELLAMNPVGVIISDQRMPAMKGTEFLSRVKELHPAVVRIMLTGYAEMTAFTEAINNGSVFRFLSKPWDEHLLRSSVREAFEQHEIERDNIRLNTQLRQSNEALLAANQRLLKRRLT